MDIYVVQQGDTVNSIAEKFEISVERLMIDNDLKHANQLVVGQSIVIAYPKQTYTVQQGDTLQSIADTNNVTVMQILRNNPYLSDREFIYPGEQLVISYNTHGSISTNGFAFAYINPSTLIKILPSLTYLSIFNYRTTEDAGVYMYYDDTEIIKITKDYGVVPLLLISVLTLKGEPDMQTAYRILLNEESQEKNINVFMDIIKNKGYGGVNIVFNLFEEKSQPYYLNFVKRAAERLRQENLLFFITINYELEQINENIDYSQFVMYTNGLIFLKLLWGNNNKPPSPVMNINDIKTMVNQIKLDVSPDNIIIGISTIAYDWKLPYEEGKTIAVSLNSNTALDLASDTNSVIQFDENSQTPYFFYNQIFEDFSSNHIVWFIDARSINAILNLIREDGLSGGGIWNIMIYYSQLWLLINAQFDIIKIT